MSFSLIRDISRTFIKLLLVAPINLMGYASEAVSVAFQRVYAKTPAMAEEHKGVKVLAVFTHGPVRRFKRSSRHRPDRAWHSRARPA